MRLEERGQVGMSCPPLMGRWIVLKGKGGVIKVSETILVLDRSTDEENLFLVQDRAQFTFLELSHMDGDRHRSSGKQLYFSSRPVKFGAFLILINRFSGFGSFV